ncbi:MAG: hypothetical protein HUJ76_03520 [Parasporobacterium sp.]|nr:hypothetical protein [Parasporobacterium sp.]
MKSVEISNIRKFTAALFTGEVFDGFLVTEAVFSTMATFSIDGHINRDFLSEEEQNLPENQEGVNQWRKMKPICYEIIKGKRIPRKFKIVFRLSEAKLRTFLEKTGMNTDPEQISGLFLNINFQEGKLYCTTGTALKTFSMDRTLEQQWDEYVVNAMKIYQ